jgi:hypothetical protein
MAKQKPKGRHPDPDGEAWFAEAGTRWTKAVAERPDSPFEAFEAPSLPTWHATATVTRELFGRYVVNRDTGIVHDVQNAADECGIDGITSATFFHFATELPDDVIDHAPCMEA